MMQEIKQKLDALRQLKDADSISEADFEREKQKLLDQFTSAGPTQTTPQQGGTTEDLSQVPGQAIFIGPPDRRYRLERSLGKGAFGEVFLADDVKTSEALGKTTWRAVKVLHKGLAADELSRKRLTQEAEQVKALRHPHIVAVHDWSIDPVQDTPFLVMEYLEGRSLSGVLADRLGKGGYPLEEALKMLRPVAQALDYAWSNHKLVHRDIKPDNLLITAPEGSIKVLDFGLAARMRSTASNAGIPVLEKAGTLDYAPPEAAAKQKAWHPSHDVYSLAVVLYQLLDPEHELPFHQRTPGTPWPARPEGLSDAQWEVLKQGLAYRQEERAPGAGAFLDAIEGAEKQAEENRKAEERKRQEDERSVREEAERRSAKAAEEHRQRENAEKQARQEVERRVAEEVRLRKIAEETARKEVERKSTEEAERVPVGRRSTGNESAEKRAIERSEAVERTLQEVESKEVDEVAGRAVEATRAPNAIERRIRDEAKRKVDESIIHIAKASPTAATGVLDPSPDVISSQTSLPNPAIATMVAKTVPSEPVPKGKNESTISQPTFSVKRPKVAIYSAIGIFTIASVGGMGYWGWTKEKAAVEQAALVAKQRSEEQLKLKEAEERRIREEEQRRLRESDAKTAEDASKEAKAQTEEQLRLAEQGKAKQQLLQAQKERKDAELLSARLSKEKAEADAKYLREKLLQQAEQERRDAELAALRLAKENADKEKAAAAKATSSAKTGKIESEKTSVPKGALAKAAVAVQPPPAPTGSTQSWNYQTFDSTGGEMALGYITLLYKEGKPILRIVGGNLNVCYRGDLDATVIRTEATTTITFARDLQGCEPDRFVIKNDGTGGQRQVKRGANWISDRRNHILTSKI